MRKHILWLQIYLARDYLLRLLRRRREYVNVGWTLREHKVSFESCHWAVYWFVLLAHLVLQNENLIETVIQICYLHLPANFWRLLVTRNLARDHSAFTLWYKRLRWLCLIRRSFLRDRHIATFTDHHWVVDRQLNVSWVRYVVGVVGYWVVSGFSILEGLTRLFDENRCALETFNQFLLVLLLNLRERLDSLSALLFQEDLLWLVRIR